MAGTLIITGLSAGLVSGGEKTIGPVTMTGSATIGEIIDAGLSSGDNTFTVPSGAVAVAIFLGSAPTATVKLRTNLNNADGGLEIAPYAGLGFAAVPLPTGTTSLILNASATVAAVELSFI